MQEEKNSEPNRSSSSSAEEKNNTLMTSEIAGDGNVKKTDANSSFKDGSKVETGNSDQSEAVGM